MGGAIVIFVDQPEKRSPQKVTHPYVAKGMASAAPFFSSHRKPHQQRNAKPLPSKPPACSYASSTTVHECIQNKVR